VAPLHRQLNGLLFLSGFFSSLSSSPHPFTHFHIPKLPVPKLIKRGILTFEFHKLFYACTTFSDIKSLPKNSIHLYEHKFWTTTTTTTTATTPTTVRNNKDKSNNENDLTMMLQKNVYEFFFFNFFFSIIYKPIIMYHDRQL